MKTLEIQIRSVTLDAPFDKKGSLSLITELVWPRPAITSRTSVKRLDLSRGKAKLPLKPLYPRILLKEKVDGRFGLSVGITGIQSNPELAEFLQSLLGTTIEATGGALGRHTGLPFSDLRKIVEAPFDQFADQIEDADLDIVAQAGFDFDSESALDGEHVFELKLNRSLRIGPEVKPGPPKGRQTRNRAGQSYRKGTVVGTAVIQLTTAD